MGANANKENMVADEGKKMNVGRERDSAIGRTGVMKEMSETKAERGGEAEARREGRKCVTDRRMLSNCWKKGSVVVEVEGSKGRR